MSAEHVCPECGQPLELGAEPHGSRSTPAFVLRVLMLENGLSCYALGQRAGLSADHVRDVLTGEAAVTPTVAAALDRATGIVSSVWLRLEAEYRESLR